MTSSQNSKVTSSEKLEQLPLKGMHTEHESERPGWRKLVKSLGDGRYLISMTRIKK